MTKTKKKKKAAKVAQASEQQRQEAVEKAKQALRKAEAIRKVQAASAVPKDKEITFKAAHYASETPAIWADDPIHAQTTQRVHLHHIAVYRDGRETSTFLLVTSARLPTPALQDASRSSDWSYGIVSVASKLASVAHKAAWIAKTTALCGGIEATGGNWPWLVSSAIADGYRGVSKVPLSNGMTILQTVARIERQLLAAEFNAVFLAGRAKQALLVKALMIEDEPREEMLQNRGEVLGDAICEVLLVADRVTRFLVAKKLSKTAWAPVKSQIRLDLTNRSMMANSVSKGAQRYIRHTGAGPVLQQPRTSTGRKAIADTFERIIGAVYESTIRTTSDGWLRGDFGTVREAAHALGLEIDSGESVTLDDSDASALLAKLRASQKGAAGRRGGKDWKRLAEACLCYTFSHECWLNLAEALHAEASTHPVCSALEVLGSALIKLLAVMYAYFKGAESALGATPSNIDATKQAWVKRGNIEELYSRKVGLPGQWSIKAESRNACRASFLRLLALAYLDSRGDLSRGPADIMANVLANQGRRIEEAIDLDGQARLPREATYSPDSDVVALPTPTKRAFEVVVLDDTDSEPDLDEGRVSEELPDDSTSDDTDSPES